MKVIKLPPYNGMGPAPFRKATKQRKKPKRAKLIDKSLFSEGISHQNHIREIKNEF